MLLFEFVNVTDSDGNTSLQNASRNGYLDIVTILIKNGAYVNVSCKNGNIPIKNLSDKNRWNEELNLIFTEKLSFQ